MRLASVVLGLSAITILAVGCGGAGTRGASTTQPAATPLSYEGFKAAAAPIAQSAELTLTDFPPGWASAVHTPGDLSLDLTPPCAAFNQTDSFPGSDIEDSSKDFSTAEAPARDQESVHTTVSVFRDAAKAESSNLDNNNLVSRCGQEVKEALQTYFEKHLGATKADVSILPVAATELGGWSSGYRISFDINLNGTEIKIESDVLSLVRGRVAATFTYNAGRALTQTLRDALLALWHASTCWHLWAGRLVQRM